MPSLIGAWAHGAAERADLLVVDDGSPDGTARAVGAAAATTAGVHLIVRAGKQGLGSAYRDGFAWALRRGYEAVVEMDADGSHDPADIPRLLDALADADFAIGSRYVPGGRIVNWGPLRRGLSLGGNLYARACLGLATRDATSGFRAYRRALLEAIDPGSVRSEGYAFQIEMVRRAVAAGGTVVEIPITFVDRVDGRSKLSRAIVLEAIVRVAWWGVGGRVGALRRRVGGGRGGTA